MDKIFDALSIKQKGKKIYALTMMQSKKIDAPCNETVFGTL